MPLKKKGKIKMKTYFIFYPRMTANEFQIYFVDNAIASEKARQIEKTAKNKLNCDFRQIEYKNIPQVIKTNLKKYSLAYELDAWLLTDIENYVRKSQ